MQELRLEDYLANRKGPTGGMVGGGLVGNQMGSLGLGGGGGGLGGGIVGGGLFGQQNKTLAGGELPDMQARRHCPHAHTSVSLQVWVVVPGCLAVSNSSPKALEEADSLVLSQNPLGDSLVLHLGRTRVLEVALVVDLELGVASLASSRRASLGGSLEILEEEEGCSARQATLVSQWALGDLEDRRG